MAGASFLDIANEISDATRVLSDAPDVRPGKPVHISVAPGFSPTLGGVINLAQTLTGGAIGSLTGSITGALLVDKVSFSVSYGVFQADGTTPVQATDFHRTPPAVAGVPDPLDVAFLLKPPVSENTVLTPPIQYHIIVTITVVVEGIPVSKSIDVPVALPALQIPAIAVIGRHAMGGGPPAAYTIPTYQGDDPNWLAIMVKAASPAANLGQVVSTINSLMEAIQDLQSVLDFTGNFFSILKLVADGINKVPLVFIIVGNWKDMSDPGGFDEEASSLILLGVRGQQLTIYKDEDFDKGGLDEEYKQFTVDDTPFPGSPVGFLVVPNFDGIDYETDSGDSLNNSADSIRFGGVP
ncbi:MAG: hypothetical protein ACRD5M_16445 [Candidatus Acidiferrales bacterium]